MTSIIIDGVDYGRNSIAASACHKYNTGNKTLKNFREFASIICDIERKTGAKAVMFYISTSVYRPFGIDEAVVDTYIIGEEVRRRLYRGRLKKFNQIDFVEASAINRVYITLE